MDERPPDRRAGRELQAASARPPPRRLSFGVGERIAELLLAFGDRADHGLGGTGQALQQMERLAPPLPPPVALRQKNRHRLIVRSEAPRLFQVPDGLDELPPLELQAPHCGARGGVRGIEMDGALQEARRGGRVSALAGDDSGLPVQRRIIRNGGDRVLRGALGLVVQARVEQRADERPVRLRTGRRAPHGVAKRGHVAVDLQLELRERQAAVLEAGRAPVEDPELRQRNQRNVGQAEKLARVVRSQRGHFPAELALPLARRSVAAAKVYRADAVNARRHGISPGCVVRRAG